MTETNLVALRTQIQRHVGKATKRRSAQADVKMSMQALLEGTEYENDPNALGMVHQLAHHMEVHGATPFSVYLGGLSFTARRQAQELSYGD